MIITFERELGCLDMNWIKRFSIASNFIIYSQSSGSANSQTVAHLSNQLINHSIVSQNTSHPFSQSTSKLVPCLVPSLHPSINQSLSQPAR